MAKGEENKNNNTDKSIQSVVFSPPNAQLTPE